MQSQQQWSASVQGAALPCMQEDVMKRYMYGSDGIVGIFIVIVVFFLLLQLAGFI